MVEQCTGFNTEYGGYGDDGSMRSSKITASSSFQATGLSCNCEIETGNVVLGLYSDNGGSPDELLGYTLSTPVVVGLHSYIMVSPVNLTNGVSYWVSVILDAVAHLKRQPEAGANSMKYVDPTTYGSPPPNPFGSSSASATGIQLCFDNTSPAASTTLLPPPIARIRL